VKGRKQPKVLYALCVRQMHLSLHLCARVFFFLLADIRILSVQYEGRKLTFFLFLATDFKISMHGRICCHTRKTWTWKHGSPSQIR
jgi:hypothetical protein